MQTDLKSFKELTEGLRTAYKSTIIGRDFVYVSKYGGETFGKIRDVLVQLEWKDDKETANDTIQYLYSGKKQKKKESSNRRYRGYRPEVKVISQNNVPYRLDEIYII